MVAPSKGEHAWQQKIVISTCNYVSICAWHNVLSDQATLGHKITHRYVWRWKLSQFFQMLNQSGDETVLYFGH